MRSLALMVILLGAMAAPGFSPAAAFVDRSVDRVKELPPSGLSAGFAPLRLAATAYKAPTTDTGTPAAGATTTPGTTPPGESTTTPATTTPATTTPATTPAAAPAPTGGTDGSNGVSVTTPSTTGGADTSGGTPAADGTAGTDAAAAPAPDVYKPPSVEVAPGGITIYRGSGTPSPSPP